MIKTKLKFMLYSSGVFLKWLTVAAVLGIIGGTLGSIFHFCIDKVTELRMEYGALLYLLPFGGLVIAAIYHLFSSKGKIDTNRVIESVRENKNIPLVMIPLIFLSTVITHMFGGSAGREGAALQLGGSIGYNLGKTLKLDEKGMSIIVVAGMSSVFSALFGTPITAAVFSLEVVTVGVFHYAGLLPCIVSSVTAYMISKVFGFGGVAFLGVVIEEFALDSFAKVAVLAVLCALVSILFCTSIKKCEEVMNKLFKNNYSRVFVGGTVIVLLTILLGIRDYNGTGMEIIARAIGGETDSFAFVLKIIFTAITIAAGFRGGEIVPAFFIGSTFGCAIAPIIGLEPSFAAAVGFVALFCGVVNCPIASVILSIEVFGTQGLLFFAFASAISYLMSGNYGLYHSQKLLYSKIDDEYIDAYAK